jgi:dephospho-CoA kinase
MIKVGLSGSRYSGKTRVTNLFKQIGIPVFDADTVLRFILNYNWELLGEIKEELGSEIFQGDYLNFREIKNPEVFNNILKMVEPDILKAYDRFNKKQTSIYTIFHSSILFERGWDKNMDKSISIFSPNTDRIRRCKNLTNMGLLTINDLTKTEMDPLEKNRLSDYTIHNYNDETSAFGDTLNQVSKVDQKIIDTFLFNEATKRVM